MNFGEFKDRIRNLGFEEEGVFDDNPSHIIQAANRANILLHNFEPEESYSIYTVPEYFDINLSGELSSFSELRQNEPLICNGSEITDYSFIDSVLFLPARYAGCNITINYLQEDSSEASAIYIVSEEFVIDLKTTISDYLSKSNKAPSVNGEDIGAYRYISDTLFIGAEYAGKKMTIPYHRMTVSVGEGDIDCRTELIPFLELLTAYYIWLDDDERKAVMYYNQFMELYQQYLSMAAGGGKGGSGSGGKFTADSQPKASIIGGIDIDNY